MGNKQKTRKAAVKRFKITGTGKILHRGQGVRHLIRNKSKRRLRAQSIPKQVTTTRIRNKIKRMLNK